MFKKFLSKIKIPVKIPLQKSNQPKFPHLLNLYYQMEWFEKKIFQIFRKLHKCELSGHLVEMCRGFARAARWLSGLVRRVLQPGGRGLVISETCPAARRAPPLPATSGGRRGFWAREMRARRGLAGSSGGGGATLRIPKARRGDATRL